MDQSELSCPLSAGLYIVATPIGNLGDLSPRAADILRRAELIACEDSRVTAKLLHHIGAKVRMVRYDDHAGEGEREAILAAAKAGPVALVSDAGTPLISDPGYRLVRAARAENIPLTSIPGPCAAIAALTVSGLASSSFLFAGFLPVKDKARRDRLAGYAMVDTTLIFYETGPRLVKSLLAIADLWPEREIAVGRELTKRHEECRTGSAAELAAHYTAQPPKGEIVLMIGPPPAPAPNEADADMLLTAALATLKPSRAAAEVARATGLDRGVLYKRALALREKGA